MKHILTVLLLFLSVSLFAQSNKSLFKITRIDNTLKHPKPKTAVDTFSYDKLDLAFYQKNFSNPPIIPKHFIDPAHKNDSINEWAMEDSIKCAYIYVSDSLSRVVKYGCMAYEGSKNKPYLWYIGYDDKNRPVKMEYRKPVCYQVITNHAGEKYKRITQSAAGGECVFTYDENNEIIQMQYLYQGKLELQVEKLNGI